MAKLHCVLNAGTYMKFPNRMETGPHAVADSQPRLHKLPHPGYGVSPRVRGSVPCA